MKPADLVLNLAQNQESQETAEQVLLNQRLGRGPIQPEALSLRSKIILSQTFPLASFEDVPDIFYYYSNKNHIHTGLFELSQIVFSAPCSQAELEQQFSSLTHTITPYRTRLSEENLNDILTVRLNKSLLKNVKYQ